MTHATNNYYPALANEKFQAWQKQYGCTITQVVCQTDIGVLAQRYFERQHTDRHPGHIDAGTVESYKVNFMQRIQNSEDQPLDVDGAVRIIDTTDFSTVNAQEVAGWIRRYF